MPHGNGRSRHGILRHAALGAAALVVASVVGCSEDLPTPPEETVTNVVTAVFQTNEEFNESPIELNGEAIDQEWGGPLQAGRQYAQIRLSADVGNGNPGPPRYVSMKAVYTEDDLFLLLQWPDEAPDDQKDFFYYVGPDLPEYEILCGPEYADTTVVRDTLTTPEPGYDEIFIDCPDGGGECDTFYIRTDVIVDECDTVRITGCRDILTDPANWVREGDEDRLVIAFEIGEAGDGDRKYAERGCFVACHANETPAFGRTGYGRLDIWQWLASRTNPVRDLYSRDDNPNFPVFGTPGYLEDMVADETGLIHDPGLASWVDNSVDGVVPRWIYRCEDDPFCEPEDPGTCVNLWRERCRINNGLPLNYLWRENRQFERFTHLSACDTTNGAPLPLGTEPRPWRFGDTVPGYILTYPSDSRADVHGSGVWEDGIWTLEVARPLKTGSPPGSDPHDAQMEPEGGFQVVFTLAIMDRNGIVHWGSDPQILRFGAQE